MNTSYTRILLVLTLVPFFTIAGGSRRRKEPPKEPIISAPVPPENPIITPEPEQSLSISNLQVNSSDEYYFTKVKNINSIYSDRNVFINNFNNSLDEEMFLVTSSKDKNKNGDSFINFNVNAEVKVIIFFSHLNSRFGDEVLSDSNEWSNVNLNFQTNLENSAEKFKYAKIKSFPKGNISIAANSGDNDSSMYNLVVVPADFAISIDKGKSTKYSGSSNRRYIVYVPSNYNSNFSYPLIYSAHGTNQDADTEMDSTGSNNGWDRGTTTWPELAEDLNAIIVTPDFKGSYGNDFGTLGVNQLNELYKDNNAILNINHEVSQMFNINKNKIMLTGFSGGGHVVHYVGLRNPNVFTHLVSRHGNFHIDTVPKFVSNINQQVYLFSGTEDSSDPGFEDSIKWYQDNSYFPKVEFFNTYPSKLHTTDRDIAIEWFLDR